MLGGPESLGNQGPHFNGCGFEVKSRCPEKCQTQKQSLRGEASGLRKGGKIQAQGLIKCFGEARVRPGVWTEPSNIRACEEERQHGPKTDCDSSVRGERRYHNPVARET